MAFLQSGNDFGVGIIAALRSLATPTPEVIKAMAIGVRRNQFERTRRHSFDETVTPTEAELNNARAAHAALWAHILGEAKPADLPPDLSTQGNR